MKYKIKAKDSLLYDGKVIAKYNKTYLTNQYAVEDTKKGKQLCFVPQGKNTMMYIHAEKKIFHKDFEVVITDTETGNIIEVFK